MIAAFRYAGTPRAGAQRALGKADADWLGTDEIREGAILGQDLNQPIADTRSILTTVAQNVLGSSV
jgi:hypothetical protein